MTQLSRIPLAVVGMLALAGLVGCTGVASEPAATPRPATEQFAELAGVVAVSPYADSATVTMAADATDAVVVDAAASIALIATQAEWTGTVTLDRDNPNAYDPETDTTSRPAWTAQVFPPTERTIDDLTQLLALEDIAGVQSVGVIDGWPYAQVASIEGLSATFRTLAASDLFENGGTVSQGDQHLQIVWVPKRTTLHAIDAIIAIAADYPEAEVLLQSTTAGPQWPELYIARLSAEDAIAIQQRLLDPSLADADVEGYGLPFILTSIGSDGPEYLDGNLGGVVEG